MAIRRRTTRPKRRAGPKRMRKGVRKAGIKRKEDYARLVESTEFTAGITTNVGNTLTFNLQQYQRAQEVAHAYKYYRAVKAEITFVPYSNFSQVGGGVGARMPNLYMTVDRVANQQINPTEEEMLERGVKPRLFNKICKLMWKPNLLQHVQLVTNQPVDGTGAPLGINTLGALNSIPVMNKWLPTQQSFGFAATTPNVQGGLERVPNAVNPYVLNYYGASWIADQEGAPDAVPVGDYQVRITWEFKGPRALATNLPSAEAYTHAEQATQAGTAGYVPNTQPTTYP